jgi:hypothetical protein
MFPPVWKVTHFRPDVCFSGLLKNLLVCLATMHICNAMSISHVMPPGWTMLCMPSKVHCKLCMRPSAGRDSHRCLLHAPAMQWASVTDQRSISLPDFRPSTSAEFGFLQVCQQGSGIVHRHVAVNAWRPRHAWQHPPPSCYLATWPSDRHRLGASKVAFLCLCYHQLAV